ncbi:MAG: hypothetical protein AAFW66_07230 [Pseudomonadota bacterium]
MAKEISELQALSNEMFDPELAQEINAEIERENAPDPGKGDAESIFTLFAADRFYRNTRTGSFAGLPNVTWNGLMDDDKTPKFLFEPSSQNPFRFIRHGGQVIQPRLMDTDGGSIPRILHGSARFDPWHYALGYIIHDWIFIAQKCGHAPDDGISFEDSATILAECIKTQMEVGFTDVDGSTVKFPKKEDTMYLIYKAVSSSFARRIWNDHSTAVCR